MAFLLRVPFGYPFKTHEPNLLANLDPLEDEHHRAARKNYRRYVPHQGQREKYEIKDHVEFIAHYNATPLDANVH